MRPLLLAAALAAVGDGLHARVSSPLAAELYPVLKGWSSGHINASALAAAEIVVNKVFNWSPHDAAPGSGWNCSEGDPPPNVTHGPCIVSMWPLITGAGAPGSANANGGVPQAANLSAHLQALR